jgi:thiol-disulfide isomerase/thioredoxin
MDPALLRVVVVVGVIVVAVLAGRWWQRRDGAVRRSGDTALRRDHLDAVGLDLAGAQAGAVLLGSSTCTPCDSVKEVLGALEAERPGFRWVYADAAEHLDLTQTHRVLRIPTVLVLEPTGRIVARSSGIPQVDDLRRVLDGGPLLGGSAA